MDRRTPVVLENYGLVADVGGTNIRFGLVDLDAAVPAVQTSASFSAAAYGGIADAARSYLRSLDVLKPPKSAAFAIAGPVNDGKIALTNSAWNSSIDELRAALQVERLRLINDYEAIALAVPLLGPAGCVEIGSAAPPSPRAHKETIAILGPGTGLGVAGLVRSGKTAAPLVTEGGHVSFAPVDEREIEILKLLMRRYGRVSVERILSGPGLRVLFEVMAEIEGIGAENLTAEQITARAETDRNGFCGRVFGQFCAVLGSVAGDVALTMGALGGVLIAGGILPAHAAMFAASGFRARFEAKGRFEDYMKKITTRLVVDTRVGLLGAASLLASEERPRPVVRSTAR